MRIERWPESSFAVFYIDENGRRVQTTTQMPSWLSDLSDELDDLIDEIDAFTSLEWRSRRADDEGDTE